MQISMILGSKLHFILVKPFNGIIGKIRQPSIAFSFQSRPQAYFVLIYPPRNSSFLQPLRERFPIGPTTIIHVFIFYIGLRFEAGFFSDCTRPHVQSIGRSASQRRAKILITNREGICQSIIKRNIFTIIIPQSQGHFFVFFVTRRFGL